MLLKTVPDCVDVILKPRQFVVVTLNTSPGASDTVSLPGLVEQSTVRLAADAAGADASEPAPANFPPRPLQGCVR